MTRITKEDLRLDETSHIDPTGRVFYHRGEIYRAFFPHASDFYVRLLSMPSIKGLVGEGKLVPSVIEPEVEVEGFGLVVRHGRLRFPSYCYEWPASMLRDAALLTLEISVKMCEEDIVLQDGTPYNVFFDSSNPVFIDLGSFVSAGREYVWAPYEQFLNFFLHPLYAYSSGAADITRRLLRDPVEGVTGPSVARLLGARQKLSAPGYLKRVSVPRLFSPLIERAGARQKMASMSRSLGGRTDMKKIRRRFLSALMKDVGRIKMPGAQSRWTDYYGQTAHEALDEKKKAVAGVLEELRPKTVLDAGCNTGEFSVLAAERGAEVVAFDSDHGSVERLYGLSREKGLRILPLVMNILDPSPGTGWRAIERPPAHTRLGCDMVLALALMHHLVFTGGQDFQRIVKSLKDFQRDWLLVEYVDKEDPMARLLPRRPSVDYGWYSLDGFLRTLEGHFRDVRVIKRLGGTRTVVLAGDVSPEN